MSLRETWTDKVDGVDDVMAEDINSIARAVVDLEDETSALSQDIEGKLGDINSALDVIISIQENLIGRTITFYIDDIKFKADENMTWGEWCGSKYNTIGAYVNVDQENIIYVDIRQIKEGDNEEMYDTDTITDGSHYYSS